MGRGTDESGQGRRACRATVCCLAMVLAVAESQAAGAVAIPAHAAPHEGRWLIAAKNTLTFSVKDIEAELGDSAPIAIDLPSAAELGSAGAKEGTFLLIRNVPEGVGFSAGMAAGRIWVVPLHQASKLRLLSAPGSNARFQLEFHLIGPNNHVLAQTTVTVDLHPSLPVAALGPAFPRPGAPEPPVQPRPPQAELLKAETEAILLARGKEILQQGGIVAARLIFEELATHGSAAGALELARSFDPAYLARSVASAPAPNLADARKWYERAAELGNPDAKRRLAEIASGR